MAKESRETTSQEQALAALYEVLDESWGPDGWSCTFSAVSAHPAAVSCLLEFAGLKRSGVGEGANLEEAALRALQMAVRQAGLELPVEAPRPAAAASEPKKPSAQELIDKLVARLREAGKGREAAALVVKYGGYGADPEATRKLYGELRALLLEKEAPA